MHKVVWVSVLLALTATTAAIASTTADRETVLDRRVHIENEIVAVPEIGPLCDQIRGLKPEDIDAGGCKLYCEQEGKGTPIVLIAGGPGCTHHLFHPHFSQAAEYARVIYYDQRGVGQSDQDPTNESYTIRQAVEDLECLRKALKIDKWVVLGHSYGGFLAQCYALEYPQRVLGLVLVCASPATPHVLLDKSRQRDYMTSEETARVRSIFGDGKLTEEQQVYNAHLNGDWKRQGFYRPTNDELARMARYEWKPAPGFRERICPDMNRVDLEGKFASFDIPTLIVEAKWDLTWNTDKPDKMLKNHRDAKMVILENSGHTPFRDEPDRFFSLLRNFIEGAESFPAPPANRLGTRIAWPPAVLGDIMAMGINGTTERAALLLKEAKKVNLMDLSCWYVLGLNLYAGHDYEKSLIAFGRAEALADTSGKPWEAFGIAAWKGIVLDLLSRRGEALVSYQKALDTYRKAHGKPDAEHYQLEVGVGWPVVDPQWVEDRLKTPFVRE